MMSSTVYGNVSGEYGWRRTRAYPRQDHSRRIVRWYGTSEDIHDREQAQEALLRQAQLLEQTYEAILVRDEEDHIVYWNQGAERVYGWTAAEAKGRVRHELLHTVFPEPLEVVRATLQAAGHWEGELTHTRRDGESVIVLSHWVRESGKQRAQILETNFDLTGQKRWITREEHAQAEVRAEQRFRELLEAAADAIFEIEEKDGRIVLVNHAAERVFGYSRPELLGRSLDTLIGAGLRDQRTHQNESDAGDLVIRPAARSLELEGQRKDGTWFPVEVASNPLYTGTVRHLVAVVRDISDRRRMEEHVRALQEQHTGEIKAKNRELERRNWDIEQANRYKSEFLTGTMS